MSGDRSNPSAQPTGAASITRHQYDWERTNPSTAVIEIVAEIRGCEPTNLDPLHGDVDPDALDALLRPRSDGQRWSNEIRFSYEGVLVELDARGSLVVHGTGLAVD